MKLTMRRYRSEDDFWQMRAFLREVFILNDRLERSWSVPRLDYWRWHFIKTCESPPMHEVTYLWETQDGQLAAFLHPIWPGEAYLQVHPQYRSAELEDEMLACAEENLTATTDAGKRYLLMTADEDDALRPGVLARRGYTKRDYTIDRCRRDLSDPIPDSDVAPGYLIRSMGGPDEYEARSWASWLAFHPDEDESGFDGGEWFENLQFAPLYRRDLDIVAEAPDGSIAAFSTIWYDDTARSAVCVLVGTAPEHQRKGLGKAVIWEGLRRLKRMGGLRVFANGFDPAASALYRSALGAGYRAESWLKFIE